MKSLPFDIITSILYYISQDDQNNFRLSSITCQYAFDYIVDEGYIAMAGCVEDYNYNDFYNCNEQKKVRWFPLTKKSKGLYDDKIKTILVNFDLVLPKLPRYGFLKSYIICDDFLAHCTMKNVIMINCDIVEYIGERVLCDCKNLVSLNLEDFDNIRTIGNFFLAHSQITISKLKLIEGDFIIQMGEYGYDEYDDHICNTTIIDNAPCYIVHF